ncbi:MAG TPA: hypothetical protein VJ860_02255 [Polyangia bacterium]|jgi:hypothetical protein|nr:hypothetical protein [Polyangia bacterium]
MQRFTLSAVARVAALAPARRTLSERRQGFRPGRLRGVALCTLLAFSACSATLTRRDGVSYEGTIAGSDAESVRIRTDSGSVERIRRADIVDIDHPGNVLGTIGLAVGAVEAGALSALLAGRSKDHAFIVTVGVELFVSVALAISGWDDYFASRRAANNFGPARVLPVGVSPVLPPNLPPPSAPAASPQPPSLDPWE